MHSKPDHGSGDIDNWPSAQRDMFQLHQAGWVFHELREKIASRVFEPLYGTRELHCSKDGIIATEIHQNTICGSVILRTK